LYAKGIRDNTYDKIQQSKAHIFNIILNGVRQHNYFITQDNYIGYMFRL